MLCRGGAPCAGSQSRGSGLSARPSRACARSAPRRHAGVLCVVRAGALPPTVADTKRKFLEAYRYPIPSVYGAVLQELLVTQHLTRFNGNYAYSPVAALGFCSVFDQLMEGFPQPDAKDAIFTAFLKSLDENPEQWRKDQAALTTAAQSGGGVAALAGMEQLAALKQRAGNSTLVYSKFIAIGLFRMLELAGVMEPQALQSLADAAGVPLSKVNADLNLYKGLLSKLSAAKELMQELLERERKKTAERQATKSADTAGASQVKPSPA